MMRHNYYHQTIRKAVIAFGNIFNSIEILRKNQAQQEVERFKVPISYGPKQKYLVRQEEDPELAKQKAILLPRMAFEISSMTYDASRKLQTMLKNSYQGASDSRYNQYVPVPYNMNFNLHAVVEYADEGNQIVEQILPYFTPDFTISLKVIPELNLIDDVPLILNGVANEDLYEGALDQRRTIIWTLAFTLKLNFYGPIRDQGLIRKVITDFHIPSGGGAIEDSEIGTTPRQARITVEPDPIDAEPTDAYGYDVTIEEFNDGKAFDPKTGTDIPVGPNQVSLSSSIYKVITNRPLVKK